MIAILFNNNSGFNINNIRDKVKTPIIKLCRLDNKSYSLYKCGVRLLRMCVFSAKASVNFNKFEELILFSCYK